MFRVLSAGEHEGTCRRCGMSCFTPIQLGNETVIIPDIYCKYLEAEPGAPGKYRCSVYEKRHEVAPWCKTVPEAIQLNALAWDCPYATGVPGFKGKRWARDWERHAIEETVRSSMIEFGLPFQDNPDAALRILNRHGETHWTYELDGDHYRFFEIEEADAVSSRCNASIDSELHQDLSYP